jgi:hypothetical protein
MGSWMTLGSPAFALAAPKVHYAAVLAEVHGKLNAESIDPVERSEDLLTDAVFGSLRHLPYDKALGVVLRLVGISPTIEELNECDVLLWPQVPLSGWSGKVIEPDVIVVIGKRMVVFEAKLHSPFDTSYRDPAATEPRGLHQLAVQHHAVARWARGSGRELAKVVAVTASPQIPISDLDQALRDADTLGHPQAIFGWLSWHRIGEALDGVTGLRVHERTLVQDLLALMEGRGVRRLFTGFKMEDYWTVAAAQHVAGDRIYPQIRTFVDELTETLGEDDIGWSQPTWRGMWMGGSSTAVSKPKEWTRGFAGAQYWPQQWPTRGKPGMNLALYAIFDFMEPGLELGLSIPGPGVAAAQQAWTPNLNGLAADLNGLRGLEIVVDTGDVSRPTRVIAPGGVSEELLSGVCSVLTNTAHLRFRRRLDVSQVTVLQARDALRDVRDQMHACPSLWKALKTSRHIDAS